MTIDFPKNSQIPELRQLWQQAFGDSDAFLDAFFAAGFSPDRCRCIIHNETVIAALYWFDGAYPGGKIAYLYAVATRKDYQHQGFCRKLMEETHNVLKNAGYAGAVLVPGSKELFAFYEKMGYRSFGGIRKFSCTPSAQEIPLRQISLAEYILLRRQYLPQGGVLQEDAALTFLETQAAFYTGEDVLLAAAKDGNTLYAPELLGNPDAAPHILHTLGATQGVFRTPGKEPFAMYLPLTIPAPPSYFGLALE